MLLANADDLAGMSLFIYRYSSADHPYLLSYNSLQQRPYIIILHQLSCVKYVMQHISATEANEFT